MTTVINCNREPIMNTARTLPPAFAPLIQLHNYPFDSVAVVGTEDDVSLGLAIPQTRYLVETPDGRMVAGWERYSEMIHGGEPLDGEYMDAFEPDGTPVILVPWMEMGEE